MTKTIPDNKVVDIINNVDHDFVLIGGEEDMKRSDELMKSLNRKPLNFVGKTDIELSAFIIQQSQLVISGDTGMMHISAALDKSTIAVFGSTHPVLGYTPFGMTTKNHFKLVEVQDLGCRPCTKQGKNKCPRGHFKCMKDIRTQTIIEKINELI